MFVMKRGNRKEVFFYLSPAIVTILFRTLVQISEGNAVTIVPIHAELTTQEAADLLNVSRPFLIRLLEREKVPFHKVGRHRRILFKDLLKYRDRSKEKSRKAREALTKQAQELDMGY
ncbi:MAG: helix-turn-helix domain-containing protein [Verrucomicrobia bacterium]|nr:helix-turn-helix domain-containing protein [Verrucomicrobiota bacterium]